MGALLETAGAGRGLERREFARWTAATAALNAPSASLVFAEAALELTILFFRFFGLSWETSTFKSYHPEDSRHSGSRRIEFSSKSTAFLM